MFKLEFSTENDAFTVDPRDEIANILRDIADRVDGLTPGRSVDHAPVRDTNGNRIGSWSYYPAGDAEG